MRISDWSSDVCSSDLADIGKARSQSCRFCREALVTSHGEGETSTDSRPVDHCQHDLGNAAQEHRNLVRVTEILYPFLISALCLLTHSDHVESGAEAATRAGDDDRDRKSTRLNSSH